MQYYVIEGIDTSGKTTQCNLIREHYPCISLSECNDSKKNEIVLLNEPGGTELGKIVREILLNERISISENSAFLLFLAQRAELFVRIKDLPNKIIADRSLISGIAYANTIDIYEALRFNLFATNGILPKKIVFLELPKDTLLGRLKQKKLDNIESKGVEFLMEIQKRFKNILNYLQTPNILGMLQQYICAKNINIDSIRPEVLLLNAELSKEELHSRICSFFGI